MNPTAKTLPEISAEDWAKTPPSVKALVEYLMKEVAEIAELKARVSKLEEENRYLREQLGRNSGNSSQPPSTDGPGQKVTNKQQGSGKKRGGQKGHRGHQRELIPSEECQQVLDYYPSNCRKCGEELSGKDPAPFRHQVVEIPEIKPYVEEHRLHQLCCGECGTLTRAQLPSTVSESGYGVRVVAIAAILSGLYRISERMLQSAMQDLFGVTLSLGTVNALRQEASLAIATPVSQAIEYVRSQPIINSDETGFSQGNADGQNPQQRKAWLWVAVTKLVTVFIVTLSRSQASAQQLLGIAITAILITDRWTAYNWLKLKQRQLCWAHLKRDFTKISERTGTSKRIGQQLLEQEKLLFTYWHQVRDGTLKRST
ncbi:MAG: IS66 family transposase, partial [Cyanobacteriota bacterium]